jgi:hypothetical protein
MKTTLTQVVTLAKQLQEAEKLLRRVGVLQILPLLRVAIGHPESLRFVAALEGVQIQHTAKQNSWC